ncbi:hypothetical protein HI113_44725 [Corallococcus exiguus]|nr:hypothetical protein [Corallococcus exiguus]
MKVQEQLQKSAEWKLGSLQRKAAELQDAQRVLIETLNDDEKLHGLFVEPTARRLHELAGRASLVEQEREAQTKIVLDQTMKVKRTERLVDTLAVEHRRSSEKKDYLALLDRLATKADASLP